MGQKNPRCGLNRIGILPIRAGRFRHFRKLKMFKKAISYVNDKSLALAIVLAAPLLASAQAVADPFDTALTTATTKVGAYAAALVGLAAVSVVFMIGMKYVKRIPRAA